MKPFLLQLLRTPRSSEALTLYTFRTAAGPEADVLDGILVASQSRKAYPVIDGIPVMQDDAFPATFLEKYAKEIAAEKGLAGVALPVAKGSRWSFSDEWAEHFEANLDKTWGWSVDQRVQQFLLETGVDAEWCRGKVILDAGCGNGQLTEALSRLGAHVVGLDFSTSVFTAEKRRQSQNVYFLRGDLRTPPFAPETFDIIVSNGVLHHTPSTYEAFSQVAKIARTGGRFYLWLYRKPHTGLRRFLLYPAIETTRFIVARMPHLIQPFVIRAFTAVVMAFHKLLGRHSGISWQERIVDMYDLLTPLWRHYHTPTEVSYWFFENGYGAASLTHWDNPFGFGMVATKGPQAQTPGINFEREQVKRRFWT